MDNVSCSNIKLHCILHTVFENIIIVCSRLPFKRIYIEKKIQIITTYIEADIVPGKVCVTLSAVLDTIILYVNTTDHRPKNPNPTNAYTNHF